jgi:hypothetical protein
MIATPFYNGQGLGNQLANYATVRTLALDKGYTFGAQFPERFKGAHFMNLDMGKPVIGGVTTTEGATPEKLPDGFTSYWREPFVDNGDYVDLSQIEDNTLIHGLLQGINYFKHRKDEIREWLKVEPYILPENLCVINFRGGEYKYVADFFLPFWYWRKAIEMMLEEQPDIQFEVHTDDPETAKLFFPDFNIVSDIAINWRTLRYCHYAILSNSSFAILPIWLNENVKKVIAPWGMGRYNTGEWLLKQNYVPEWTWIDRENNICTG